VPRRLEQAQIIAGRGLAAVTAAVDPAPFRCVLPLPISALRSASPVLANPANRNRAVPLTFEQFRYGFANAVSEEEAKELYETYAVPGLGEPVFQAAAENLNPWSEAKVDTKNPDRGPLLIISGEKDHTVPWAVANSSYKRQEGNAAVTEIIEIKGRGHALTIDNGWREAPTRHWASSNGSYSSHSSSVQVCSEALAAMTTGDDLRGLMRLWPHGVSILSVDVDGDLDHK
jgi:pimeloyl-ACP methyl ester carboxylesterase